MGANCHKNRRIRKDGALGAAQYPIVERGAAQWPSKTRMRLARDATSCGPKPYERCGTTSHSRFSRSQGSAGERSDMQSKPERNQHGYDNDKGRDRFTTMIGEPDNPSCSVTDGR